jgi:hypothetical protein
MTDLKLVKFNVIAGEIEKPKLTKPEKDWMEKADEEDNISLIIIAKNMIESLSKDALEKNLPFKVKFEFLENHPLAEKYSQYL